MAGSAGEAVHAEADKRVGVVATNDAASANSVMVSSNVGTTECAGLGQGAGNVYVGLT